LNYPEFPDSCFVIESPAAGVFLGGRCILAVRDRLSVHLRSIKVEPRLLEQVLPSYPDMLGLKHLLLPGIPFMDLFDCRLCVGRRALAFWPAAMSHPVDGR